MLQLYFVIYFFSRDHVRCHIVSLGKEYLLHAHLARCDWMIFQCSYLHYTVMVTIGSWVFLGGGGSFYSLNTLDRTITTTTTTTKNRKHFTPTFTLIYRFLTRLTFFDHIIKVYLRDFRANIVSLSFLLLGYLYKQIWKLLAIRI